jgi:hypothetical protein
MQTRSRLSLRGAKRRGNLRLKPVLQQIHDMASAMHLQDERFIRDLHQSYDRRTRPTAMR